MKRAGIRLRLGIEVHDRVKVKPVSYMIAMPRLSEGCALDIEQSEGAKTSAALLHVARKYAGAHLNNE